VIFLTKKFIIASNSALLHDRVLLKMRNFYQFHIERAIKLWRNSQIIEE